MKKLFSILTSLISFTLLPSNYLLGQDDGQSGGGESAAESSVTTSSSQKSAAAPETIESNPIITVVKTGLPIASALSSGLTIDKIVKLAQAGGSISNLKTVSAQVKSSGATYLNNMISAAEKGITFKSASDLSALNTLVTATGFDATKLDVIKSNQDAGVSIVQQEEIGVDSVKNAVDNGDSAETIAALYESVKDLSDEDKEALVAASTAELSEEIKAFKATLTSSITVSDPVKSNLNLAINAVIADADYTGQADLQEALTYAVSIANTFLEDVTVSGSESLTSDDVYNVASLTENGYNTEFIKLLIKYGAIGDKGSALATGALSDFSTTATTSSNLSSLLKASTSDYLGLLSILTNNSVSNENWDEDNFFDSQTNTVLNVSMDKVSLAPGSNIKIGAKGSETSVNVSTILKKASNHDDRKILVVGAAKDLTIVGDTTFINSNDVEDHALVLGAADELYFRSEYSSANAADYTDPDTITLEYTGSNLGLGSESEMRLVNVDIKTGGNLAIASLDKVYIGQTDRDNLSTFTVGTGGDNSDPDNVYIYANELIQVNGLAFAGRVDDVYMDAITIDLGNVTFPTNSDVLLRSRDGGLNFGDKARTVGDVNFIENVKHLSISDSALTASDFDFSKGDGHINSSSALPNGTPHIKIRSR
jgi:hypothetical protein